MTLATHLLIQEPLNPEIVFMAARRAISIPAEHPFQIGVGRLGNHEIVSAPAGFGAFLGVNHNDGRLLTHNCAWDGCNKPCQYPDGYVDVRLDTTYGYRWAGGGCNELHRLITADLGLWLDEQSVNWWCRDENWGTWHERTPCPREKAST